MTKKDGPREVPIEEVDLEALKRNSSEKKSLATYATDKGSAIVSAQDPGNIKSRSHAAMVQQIDRQMDQIKQQIQLLASQVDKLQKRRDVSEIIYTSQMSFEPLIGHSYFLYRRPDKSEQRLMMIAPDEWDFSKKNWDFIAKVTLLADRTWDVADSDE